jgi:hypothetical protein
VTRGGRFGRGWLVAIAVVGSFVAMELALQVASLAVRTFAGERRIEEGQGAVILCVGDSHTYGLPLPEEESYPSQLQRALDHRHGEGTFRVVNLGIPSVNSDFVLNRLERQIVQLDPVVVVVWVGINNLWNAVELDARVDEPSPAWLRWAAWSRLGRLFSIAFHRGVGHQYDPDVRGGWYDGEAAPSGVAAGRRFLPDPGPGLERDLVAMGELARRHDLPIVFISYPLRSQRAISRSIERAAGRLGAPLVDAALDLERARADGHGRDALIDRRAGPHPSKLLYGYVVESLTLTLEGTVRSWYGEPRNGTSARSLATD